MSAEFQNLRTAPQTKDQRLEGRNLALSRNVENGRPVRVMRGYKLNSPYGTDWGFRYDGPYLEKNRIMT
ncbi:MAG: hypothetical protein GY862_04805 [Gammaproteobacteria bacterium]|nr:hypothetical protein [Gammaproteobacteria bacterium]